MYGFTSDQAWLAWKLKRRNSLIGFVIVGTIVGIDTSIVFSTLFLYLRDLVKTDRPALWFGVILATFYTSSSIFAGVSGRWLDKTRKVRMYINFSLLVQAIGFLIYAVPYNPLNILAGRFICGIGEPFISVICGEVFRIYTDEESNRAMLWLASTYSFGFIIGPSLNTMFVTIDFYIGWIRINRMNFVAIFMAFCLLVVMIIANYLISNCSAEFDLKEFLSHQEATTDKDVNHEDEQDELIDYDLQHDSETEKMLPVVHQESIPVKNVLRTLATNIDTVLMFTSSFTLMYMLMVASTILPLMVTTELQWGVKGLSILYAIYGIGDFVILMTLAVYCRTNRSIYYTSVLSITNQLLLYVILLILSVVERYFPRDVGLMGLFLLTFVISWIFDDVLVRVMLGKMVPSNIQSFTEGLRCGVAKFSIILATLSTPFVFQYITWVSVGSIIIIFLIILCFIIRRKYLIEPKEVKFKY